LRDPLELQLQLRGDRFQLTLHGSEDLAVCRVGAWRPGRPGRTRGAAVTLPAAFAAWAAADRRRGARSTRPGDLVRVRPAALGHGVRGRDYPSGCGPQRLLSCVTVRRRSASRPAWCRASPGLGAPAPP
jgi:hypothetical protein